MKTPIQLPRPHLRIATSIVVAAIVVGCLPVADDQAARERVLHLVRADELSTVDGWRKGWIYMLPDDLDQVSQGGEIAVQRDSGSLVVEFFDVRGLNHWTGWVYSSNGPPAEDPLGNQPFTSHEIAPNWYRVDAG